MARYVLAICALVLVAAVQALAATYYLSPAGGDDTASGLSADAAWKTLDKANAAVEPGDTVILRGGVYGGESQVKPSRSGTAEGRITYAAAEGETPEITGGRWGTLVYLDGTGYITVRGLKLHSPTEHDWVVRISGEDARCNRIENCDISDPQGYAPVVITFSASNNEVIGCTVHDAGHAEEGSGDCIVLNEGAHHNTIRGNKCFNGCHSQIMALNGAHDNVIADNELYSTDRAWAGAGVNLPRGADRNMITGNRIHDLGFITDQKCAIQVDSAENVIAGNVICNVGAFGISLQSYYFGSAKQEARGNRVEHNTLYNCGSQPITIFSKRDCLSRDNVIADNIVMGRNAEWYGQKAAILVFDTWHMAPDFDVTAAVKDTVWFGNVFRRNVIFNGRAGEDGMALYNARSGVKVYSLPDLEREFPDVFSLNIEADPQFLDPASGDFRIRPLSPASVAPEGDSGARTTIGACEVATE